MVKDEKGEKIDTEKLGFNSLIQYGTFNISLLGTIIAVQVYDYIRKHSTSELEA
jgi:hypothetical protein